MKSSAIHFIANRGQWPDSILYRADAPHGAVWFTGQCTYAQLTEIPSTVGETQDRLDRAAAQDEPSEPRTLLVASRFEGASPAARLEADAPLASYSNFFLGDRPERWRTRVPHYAAVVYRDVYPGVDVRYYGAGSALEYDLLLAPGSDVSQVRISHHGVERLEVTPDGGLVLHTALGAITQPAPITYQADGRDTTWLSGSFVERHDGTVGFAVTSPVEPTLALVVDPVIEFSTYLGGGGEDGRDNPNNVRSGIAATSGGDIIVAGQTMSADFPTVGAPPYDNC